MQSYFYGTPTPTSGLENLGFQTPTLTQGLTVHYVTPSRGGSAMYTSKVKIKTSSLNA